MLKPVKVFGRTRCYALCWEQLRLLLQTARYGTLKKQVILLLTGDGNSAAWNSAEWLVLPKRDGGPVNYLTRFKIMYSDSGIYCLYHCEDRKITATLTEDFADLYNEDVVEAFFWTDEKNSIYFEYELSPLNYELPILVPNFNGKFYGWRPWHYEGNRRTRHAVSIQKKDGQVLSWTAEFFIPFKLLSSITGCTSAKGYPLACKFLPH